MHRLAIILFVILTGCSSNITKRANDKMVARMDSLIEVKDFFKLKTSFKEGVEVFRPSQSLYYKAYINSKFNRYAESNNEINELLSNYREVVDDTIMNKLYWIKLTNHVNLFEYRLAMETDSLLLTHYKNLNDSASRERLINENKIWKALADVPKQVVKIPHECKVHTMLDKLGLFHIDTSIKDSTQNMIFDIGANFSVMKRSLAESLGLNIKDINLEVSSATGLKVNSDLAIVDSIIIGDIAIKNAVFLVFDDQDLWFPHVNFQINGIIGYPVIEALREIRISRNNTITIPEVPAEYLYDNFVVDEFTPIIAVNYKSDTLRFGFDTGATSTNLFKPYFTAYKDSIENIYSKVKFRTSSAGGTMDFEGYLLHNLHLKIADSEAILNNIQLHIEDIGDKENKLHGNIGHDFFKQFNEIIISFEYSSVTFQ